MRIKNIKKFISSTFILILSIISILVIFINIIKKPKYIEKYKSISISDKDTLWKIAEQYSKPDQDTREYIYEIKKLNNMNTSALYEGQELIIITYEEVN